MVTRAESGEGERGGAEADEFARGAPRREAESDPAYPLGRREGGPNGKDDRAALGQAPECCAAKAAWRSAPGRRSASERAGMSAAHSLR
jgi:hypothetical protein